MTAPQQPQPNQATVQALAATLWQANTTTDIANTIAVVFLLDVPTALAIVTAIWQPTQLAPRPWRKTPTSRAAAAQAAYLLAAIERIRQAAAGGELGEALAREHRYAMQHKRAQIRRASAMTQVRKARRNYGTLLGWKATIDARTTLACRLANGKNFPAQSGPFPGMLHGGTCRCRPVRPYKTNETVLSAWVRAGIGPDAEGAYTMGFAA
jgi:hypothetical protein